MPTNINRIVAGAIYDFLGHLTSRLNVMEVGSDRDVTPVLDELKHWAKTRNLDIEDADVRGWELSLSSNAEARELARKALMLHRDR